MLGLTIWSRTQLSSGAMCLQMIANNACFVVNNLIAIDYFMDSSNKLNKKHDQNRECVYVTLWHFCPPRYPHYSQDTRTAQYLSLYVDDQRLGLWDGSGVEHGADIAIF